MNSFSCRLSVLIISTALPACLFAADKHHLQQAVLRFVEESGCGVDTQGVQQLTAGPVSALRVNQWPEDDGLVLASANLADALREKEGLQSATGGPGAVNIAFDYPLPYPYEAKIQINLDLWPSVAEAQEMFFAGLVLGSELRGKPENQATRIDDTDFEGAVFFRNAAHGFLLYRNAVVQIKGPRWGGREDRLPSVEQKKQTMRLVEDVAKEVHKALQNGDLKQSQAKEDVTLSVASGESLVVGKESMLSFGIPVALEFYDFHIEISGSVEENEQKATNTRSEIRRVIRPAKPGNVYAHVKGTGPKGQRYLKMFRIPVSAVE